MDVDIRVLFEEKVKMRWIVAGAEDQMINALVRLEFGSQGQKLGKILRLRLTNNDNLYFLHSLEISEEDFQSMKHEQSLLVDFVTFPLKTIELFKMVIKSASEETPRYVAQLSTRQTGTDSTLQIVETNPFKHLVHLALGFRAGNDTAVKKHLAAEMQMLQTSHNDLMEEHAATTAMLAAAQRQLEIAAGRDAENRKLIDQSTLESRVAHAAELNEIKERHLSEVQAVRDRYEADMRQLRSQADEQIGGLTGNLAGAHDTIATLKTNLSEKERTIRELDGNVTSLESEVSKLRITNDELREQNRVLDRTLHEGEKRDSRVSAEVEGLRSQLADAQAMTGRVQALADAASARASGLADTQEMLKTQVAKLEDKARRSVEEINKANQIIQTLQTELKASRAKAKASRATVRDRDDTVASLRDSIREAERQADSMRRELEGAGAEKERVEARVVDLTAKLAEAQAIIESNQKVMAYLNSELTERRLGNSRHTRTAPPTTSTTTVGGKPLNFTGTATTTATVNASTRTTMPQTVTQGHSAKAKPKAATTGTIPLAVGVRPGAGAGWAPAAAPRFTAYADETENNPLFTTRHTHVHERSRPRDRETENAVVNESIEHATRLAVEMGKGKGNAMSAEGDSLTRRVLPAGLVPETV